MKKNLSITNPFVLKAMEQSEYESKLIETAVLYYLDSLEKEYIMREEVEEMLETSNKEFKICNENYLQDKQSLEELMQGRI